MAPSRSRRRLVFVAWLLCLMVIGLALAAALVGGDLANILGWLT